MNPVGDSRQPPDLWMFRGALGLTVGLVTWLVCFFALANLLDQANEAAARLALQLILLWAAGGAGVAITVRRWRAFAIGAALSGPVGAALVVALIVSTLG